MDDDTGGRKQDSTFTQGDGRLRERPHGLEQGLQDGDHGRIEQHRIIPGQDGAPGPEAIFLHQMLDEAPPKELIPIDKPGPGIMPGEQEQQPREQQGRGSRPYVVPPRDSRVEQCKTDRQQGKDGEDSYGKAHFMIHPAHGRKDLQ